MLSGKCFDVLYLFLSQKSICYRIFVYIVAKCACQACLLDKVAFLVQIWQVFSPR